MRSDKGNIVKVRKGEGFDPLLKFSYSSCNYSSVLISFQLPSGLKIFRKGFDNGRFRRYRRHWRRPMRMYTAIAAKESAAY
ncbi:hypothetical protein IC575_004995 [Cucumis melo]